VTKAKTPPVLSYMYYAAPSAFMRENLLPEARHPLYPRKWTFIATVGMSTLDQKLLASFSWGTNLPFSAPTVAFTKLSFVAQAHRDYGNGQSILACGSFFALTNSS
jgi:hypothetical protein